MPDHFTPFKPDRWIALPGLDTRVQLPTGDRFRYDGPVPDLSENLALTEEGLRQMTWAARKSHSRIDRWLDAIFSRLCPTPPVRVSLSPDILAYCYPHNLPDDHIGYVIARCADLAPEMALFADGHESGELLLKLQRPEVLSCALAEAGITGVDAQDHSGEDYCDVGGLLALHKARVAGADVHFPSFRNPRPVMEGLREAFGL